MKRALLEFVDSLFEPIEVEFVFNEILVDLTEEEMILKTTEPLDPPYINVFAELRLFAHVLNYQIFELKSN